MVEGYPQLEKGVCRPLRTVHAMQTADEECAGEQLRPISLQRAPLPPDEPASPKAENTLEARGLPGDLPDLRRRRTSFHVVNTRHDGGREWQHGPVPLYRCCGQLHG